MNASIIGSEINAERTYAIGCETSIPRIPKNAGKTEQSGMNISPHCKHESMSAGILFPRLWKSIVATTDIGKKRSAPHCILSASEPILTTSGSSPKIEIIAGAKIKHAAAIIPINTVPKKRVKKVPSFTLPYFLAP